MNEKFLEARRLALIEPTDTNFGLFAREAVRSGFLKPIDTKDSFCLCQTPLAARATLAYEILKRDPSLRRPMVFERYFPQWLEKKDDERSMSGVRYVYYFLSNLLLAGISKDVYDFYKEDSGMSFHSIFHCPENQSFCDILNIENHPDDNVYGVAYLAAPPTDSQSSCVTIIQYTLHRQVVDEYGGCYNILYWNLYDFLPSMVNPPTSHPDMFNVIRNELMSDIRDVSFSNIMNILQQDPVKLIGAAKIRVDLFGFIYYEERTCAADTEEIYKILELEMNADRRGFLEKI